MADWLPGDADALEETALKAKLRALHIPVNGAHGTLAKVCLSVFYSDKIQSVVAKL
jgi:hypothetical protein